MMFPELFSTENVAVASDSDDVKWISRSVSFCPESQTSYACAVLCINAFAEGIFVGLGGTKENVNNWVLVVKKNGWLATTQAGERGLATLTATFAIKAKDAKRARNEKVSP